MLGLGKWGKNHARVALELLKEGRIDRLVLCDSDPRKTEPYRDLTETSTDPGSVPRSDVDAVDIVTPAEHHFPLARDALEAGKHVLVEKPMTVHGRDAEALVKLAEARGRVLMPGHVFRYHPGILKLEELLRTGALGAIRYLGTTRTGFANPRSDVGVLYSLAIHEADLYPHLLGEEFPLEAWSHAAAFLNPRIDEVASLFFRFRGGTVGYAFASWITPGEQKERRLVVVGTRASVEVDYRRLNAITFRDAEMVAHDGHVAFREGESRELPVAPQEPLRSEIEDFVRAAGSDGQVRPRADAASAWRAVEVIEALKTKGTFLAASMH